MKLLLVDGHYYLYRSFHAVQGLRNSRGEPSNALFGFAKALLKMLADLQPTHGAVLWDAGVPQHRLDLCPAYKQNRPPMPDDLRTQEPHARQLPPLLGLQSLHIPLLEADDLIAALANAAPPNAQVLIASADKDILQLLSPNCKIYSTNKADLPFPSAPFALLGPHEVEKKWGVPPTAIPDLLSLTGDSSDNIPGIPGIGPKTAANLLRKFGSLQNLLENLPAVTPAKLRDQLAAAKNQLLSNLQLIRLNPPPPPTTIESLTLNPQPEKLNDFFHYWEFHSLLAPNGKPSPASSPSPPPPRYIQGKLPL